LSTARPDTAAAPLAQDQRRLRPSALAWLPALVLAAGLALGLLLWGKWGLAIAFEAIRTYCF
jgi:hypothetical protein